MVESGTAQKEVSARVPSPGTRPDGIANEAEASRKVREMFTKIAPRYDLVNHVLSLEMDRMWRARMARILRPLLEREDARILDLCCGTGDLTFALQRKAKGRVWGADFAHPMLVRAREKDEEIAGWRIPFVESDALRLPFANGSFDLVTTAFGFRNLANYEAGLQEIRRVLKPGGTAAILEFTEPKPGWFGELYRWYFRSVLPRLGGMISGDCAAYKYLPSSVARFLRPEELTELMERNGFAQVTARVWTGGTLALHVGVKKL
ncbi:MAG TPA: bifunctional demethylmenaquinone methyltransferase/2-methoxy-6-polyprenyl-1,4-benzoquinol methylase UbiE [Candidatus Acidoferrum sp.]|nr:bifunctional demethylmenaquinone methyltransferase/2-methoxy-6-polyprenyl-1,4-benzoquinol methylase UbiE [Candidatus Acidoferrum sp.]